MHCFHLLTLLTLFTATVLFVVTVPAAAVGPCTYEDRGPGLTLRQRINDPVHVAGGPARNTKPGLKEWSFSADEGKSLFVGSLTVEGTLSLTMSTGNAGTYYVLILARGTCWKYSCLGGASCQTLRGVTNYSEVISVEVVIEGSAGG
jgi:hypothetical protein